MANGNFKLGKRNLLSSTALTKQVAAFSALGLVFGASSAYALDAGALPEGGNVVGGAATISQAGSTMNIKQTTNRTVIDWRSFNIGSKAAVDFAQPGASSIAVNRVNSSANPTQIQGSLHANGQVWILNPNGVLFGKTARVDVAGIVASTGNINKDAFMRGDNRLHFTGPGGGEVSNAGLISVADGGLAAFVAPSVRNSGVIRARVGKVTLAAGTTFTLDLAGDDLVELGLGADHALVDQSGELLAAGSIVNLTAKAAGAVVDSVINVSGTVLASGITEKGGKIILTADNITTGPDAVLAADGGTNGDGGTIYAYANNTGNYDGTFSARGGSASGDGGSIETSGKKVQIASGISVDTRAVNGETGNWTIDPDDLVIGGAGADVDTATIVAAMDNTGMTLTANNSITVNEEINSSTQANTNTLALNDENANDNLTINLNDKIILGANQHLTGQGTTVNVADGASIQNGVDVAAENANVNVAAGDYTANNKINKTGLTLTGDKGAKIAVGTGQTGVSISANNVTVDGFEFAGPVSGDYQNVDWVAAGSSTAIAVTGNSSTGPSTFHITNNDIHDVRTGIIVQGNSASGEITGNEIENTKGGILIQYNDGTPYTISGNTEGAVGNEWGIVLNLNTAGINSVNAPTSTWQQSLLDLAGGNGDMAVMDRHYKTSNRTRVVVDSSSTATAANDGGYGNGLGNERQPINNIKEGINAVVAGGTVNVNDGTYVIPAGGANYISIGKSLNLIGESEAGTIIDAHGASSYGIRVIGGTQDVNLSNFTLYGVVAAGGYGIKVEDSQNVNIDHVTSHGAYKAQFDLNGVRGGTLDHVTADGTSNGFGSGSVKGAAIAITDSQDIKVQNSSTNNGSYGGIGIYQANKSTGYTYQADNITIAVTNTFGEANAVYTEDESATNDFGTLNIAGFDYAVGNNGDPTDVYTWFQKTQQGAVEFATTVNADTATVQGWTGTAVDNIFTVGYNIAGTVALSINTAVNAATSGATVNVLPGEYTESVSGVGRLDEAGPYNFGLYVAKDNITIQGVDANGDVITDPNATLAKITSGNQSVFGAQNWVSGDDVTIQGLTFLPGTGLDNKLLEVVGDNFTLRNSVLDASDNGTESALYMDVQGAGPVESFNIQNNIFYGGTYTGTDGGGIVKIAGGVGLTTPASQRIFDGNLVTVKDGHGTSDTVGFQIQGQQDGVAWQNLEAGSVTVTNNTFSNIDTPVRTVGNLVENLAWNDIFRNNGNTFADGGAMAYAGDTTDARAGTVLTYYGDPTPAYAIFAKVSDAVGFNGLQTGDTVRVLAGTYADNVSINKGITLAGAGMDETYLTGGIDLSNTAFSDLVFKDFTVSGASSNAVVKNGKVTNFTMDHVRIDGENVANQHGFASGKFYGDISITNSEFMNIRGWSSFDNSTGSSPTDLTSVNFSNNLLDNTIGHITFRGAPANAPVTISNNIVRNVGDTTDLSGGIFKVFGADTVDFSNNDISGIGAIAGKIQNGVHDGAALIVRDVATLNVTGNTFTDNQEAILVDDGKNLPTVTNFIGNTFTNNAYDINFGNGVGTASVVFGAGNSFNSGAATQQHLIWAAASNIDMTNVQFDGKLGSAMTNAQLFALEDQITHGLDNASAGLVTVKADNVYVTQASGSIQNAVDKVSADDTINVGAGTYGAFGTSFGGASDLTIQTTDGAIIDGTGLTGRIVDLRADGTTFSGFTINGDGTGVGVSVSGQGVTVSGNTINNTLTGVQTTTQYPAGNATISGNVINTAYGISLQNSGNNVTGNDVTASTEGVGLLTGDNTFTGNTFDIAASGTALALYDTASAGDLTVSDNNVTIAGGGLQGAIDLAGTGGDLTVNGGTYNEDVVVGSARNISFVGATIDKFTTNVATAIGGTVSAVNGFFLNGLTTLLSNTVLNGAVTAGSVDGTGHSFTVNNGATVLNGNSYKASSLTFNGSSTQLTQASTSFDTSAAGGDITFTGPIVGTADGAQAIVLNAGPGTAAGANGDISLQNVGSNALWLGDMTVTGDDFSAATVYVNNFTATLMGNQTFTSTTLHTRGDVNSNVGGDATGPIDSQGDVNVNAGGDFSGDVSGSTMNISAQNIDGSFTGGSTSLNATNNVNATTNVTDLTVNSPSGTVNGTYTSFDATGGPIVVNGKTQTGDTATNPNQIIVEGFTLPAGAIVTSSGEIILPDGMLVGLVSPAAGPGAEGGKAKVVIVHNVQMLGQLLAEGYVAIIVDLSKNDDDIQEVAMN